MQHEGGRRGMHIGYWWEIQKRSSGRPRRRRVDNIKIDLREIGWIDTAQDRDQWRALVNTVLNVKFLSYCTIGVSSKRSPFREEVSK
jgi:hypothetical protein